MKLAIVDDSNENVSFVVGNLKNVFSAKTYAKIDGLKYCQLM